MKTSKNISVKGFINDIRSISPEQAETINSIRRLFNKANKELIEEIKYGGITFVKSGDLVGGIFSYKEHISIEFSNGADFSDPSVLLEGKGKRRRHLKIYENKDVKDKNASFFIKQAVSGSQV